MCFSGKRYWSSWKVAWSQQTFVCMTRKLKRELLAFVAGKIFLKKQEMAQEIVFLSMQMWRGKGSVNQF